jgi:hypothetical protein
MAIQQRLRGMRAAAAVGLAGALLLASAPVSVAAAPGARAQAPASAAVGTTYGGLTSQGYPVVVDTNRTRRQIVRAVVVVEMTCTSGDSGLTSDIYRNVGVTKRGKFSISFGPQTVRNDDGTTSDYEGSFSGRLNPSQSRIFGTWRYKFTNYDAAGAVTDTCDSGRVSWTAKQ